MGCGWRIKNSKGFTAVEVLIAAMVLAIVLLAVATMFASGTQNIASGGNRSMAAFFVHQKLEEIRNSPVFPPAPVSPVTDNPAPGFTRSWAVSSLTGASPSRIATVSVTVSWADSTGPKSVQSVTYLPEL